MMQQQDTGQLEMIGRLMEAPAFRLYNLDFTVALFTEERLKHFEELSKQTDRLRVYDFVKFGLLVIGEGQQERVFLAYGLLKLFEEVCRANNRDSISFLDFTSFVVDKLPKLTQEVRIQQKLLPFGLDIAETVKRTLIAPQVYGKKYNALRRLEPDFIYCDHYQHLNRKIEKATHSISCHQFITMDNPSSQLQVFDAQCRHFKSIETELQLANREAIIIAYAWAETERRVGCILANYSSSFWSSTDEFRFELNVPLRRDYLKHPPIRIYYLECEKKWIKFDSVPNIYSLSQDDFDICEVFHHSKLKCEKDDSLLIAQAAYHKLLILGFDRTILLLSVERKEIVSELHGFHTNIYTLCFSEAYQVLLVGCFETYICSYELSEFCDLTEKGRFKGHRSHVTALLALQNTPIVLTVQDEGTMKLWDIRDLTCFQTLAAPSNIVFRSILQMENKICLVGSKLFVFAFEQQKETYDRINVFDLRMVNRKLMAATNEAVYFFNVDTGRATRIIKAIYQDEDIVACEYLPNQNMLLLVNPRGLMKAIDAQNGGLVTEIQLLQGRPIRLRYEDHVKMLFYSSDEAIGMYQYDPKRASFELKRDICSHEDTIKIADGSCLHDLVAFTYGGNVVYFYTHERAKPLGSVLMAEPVVDLLFVTTHKLIGVLTESSLTIMSYEINYGTITTTVRYLLERMWMGGAISARTWQTQNSLMIASATGHLLLVENKFTGQGLGQQLERNNYNPYRIGNESHKESFKRFRPMLSKRGKEEYLEVTTELHHHRRQITGLVKYGENLFSVDVEGSLRLTNPGGQVAGRMHLLNPLPQFWNSNKDKRTELEEMQFVLEMMEHLRLKNPKFAEYFTIDEFLRGMDQETYLTQTIARLSRGSRRPAQQPVKIVAGTNTRRHSQKIITSLRQKKIIVEKQRDQRRNQDNYESLVKLNAKNLAVKQIGESQREKDIIMFFDESSVEAVKNRNIKQPILPPEMKQLEQRLNSLLRRSEERSYITQFLQKNRSSVTPVKLPTEARSMQPANPLNFYSTELLRERSQPKNALDLVKTLKVSLLDSKFSRNSTSLPKLRSVSLRR